MLNIVILSVLLLAVSAKKGDGCNCDLEIVIDTSCSIPTAARPKIFRFIKEVLESNFKKVGVIAYDKTVREITDPISNDNQISKIIDALPKSFWCTKDSKPGCCNTRTNEALQAALNVVEDLEAKRKNTCKVILLFTDGKTFPKNLKGETKSVADYIHKKHPDWTVIAVGVGNKIDVNELKAIASGDASDNVILKPDFNSIRGIDICPDLKPPVPDNDPPCHPDDDDGEDDDPTPQK
eukprot:NODE_5736_length_975_cov_48.883803_g5155_i0.p1 GENE.NODE_5736_length_975_cov_48.883803_g5155_i0~~NODE_5736_length_975_cov_48.883803_g5155_i0.p1  ORF type:complete len:251 (-),score=45.42 NODE_5736_length_975_cov_48.883803_g5155_i0:223-933(-)